MKYLYRKAKFDDIYIQPTNIDIQIFVPRIFGKLTLPSEDKNLKLIGIRLLFQVITFGKARVFCAVQNGELVHTSYVVPKCFKFPFLNTNDYEIGPCFTYPTYQRNGIYTAMLRYICNSVGTKDTIFYMIVDGNNIASIKGIEKAGFERCGNVKVIGIVKKYQAELLS